MRIKLLGMEFSSLSKPLLFGSRDTDAARDRLYMMSVGEELV